MEGKFTGVFAELESFIRDMIDINNEQQIKIMHQLLLNSFLLTLYLSKKGIIQTDYAKYIEENKEMASKFLAKQSEDVINEIRKAKEKQNDTIRRIRCRKQGRL